MGKQSFKILVKVKVHNHASEVLEELKNYHNYFFKPIFFDKHLYKIIYTAIKTDCVLPFSTSVLKSLTI